MMEKLFQTLINIAAVILLKFYGHKLFRNLEATSMFDNKLAYQIILYCMQALFSQSSRDIHNKACFIFAQFRHRQLNGNKGTCSEVFISVIVTLLKIRISRQ